MLEKQKEITQGEKVWLGATQIRGSGIQRPEGLGEAGRPCQRQRGGYIPGSDSGYFSLYFLPLDNMLYTQDKLGWFDVDLEA